MFSCTFALLICNNALHCTAIQCVLLFFTTVVGPPVRPHCTTFRPGWESHAASCSAVACCPAHTPTVPALYCTHTHGPCTALHPIKQTNLDLGIRRGGRQLLTLSAPTPTFTALYCTHTYCHCTVFLLVLPCSDQKTSFTELQEPYLGASAH